MNTATKLSGFALGLTAVFGAAYGVGHLAGPVAPAAETRHDATAPGHDLADAGHGDGHASGDAAAHLPGGLLVSDRGYTLQPVTAPAGEFAFRISGPDGRPVTRFDVAHDKRMHLIVARRDLSGFRHVHPELTADGTWRVASPLAGPGVWRAFADFTPTGAEPLTLGVDVTVPGALAERPLPAPATSTTVDGYTVTLTGAPQPGRSSRLTLTVSRDGRPVTDLQPYLGAYGHLVALRQGDLAYLHVHPEGAPGDGRTPAGPAVSFAAEVPSAGAYRLYLDFRHGDAVHTAEFTVLAGDVPPPAAPAPTTAPTPDADHGTPGHGHS
ncbi:MULTISPECIES: hypothetical protein [Micromonospora]|uniref:Heavy metal-binding domain-containing protein n=1 Tax=Micromonospora solifontis TaxID=2487138 RepID=A0ABX9WKK0_9ACTN|nr:MULTISPECIES: hypothetical protein [Micromonospora]NES14790.1 hypothetical protein [Micromonospora sp. PPF5-17B]NES35354.1 hypothetical protein [Micromonospora solifontis]NES56164.1 hypothetical protein [Micromonospora sp. PPF5-6]RNM00850.1 hypothetical protein EFE23_04145 [Micromonospora solifontis]